MKTTLGVAAAAGLLIFAAQAQGGQEEAASLYQGVPAAGPAIGWEDLAGNIAGPSARATVPVVVATPDPMPELDVVDAHWMALTMWGEARGQGEEAMRAVGHVIDNRRRAGGLDPGFVTDTVSEAFQFSCWNAGDPNRAAMLNVDALPLDSRDYGMWAAARHLAEEILAGRSLDPTGGARFYHAAGVSPTWSRGVAPVARIGDHLFYRTTRRP